MTRTPRFVHAAIAAVCSTGFATAGVVALDAPDDGRGDLRSPVDLLRSTVSYSGAMGIANGPGRLEASEYELRYLMARRLNQIAGWNTIPLVSYTLTTLDFSGTAAGFPASDEGLHSIDINKFFFRSFGDNGKWLAGGWTRAGLSTDFQHLTTDDLFFDVAAAVGYRFNERFAFGIGVAAFDLSGDTKVIPAPSFDWVIDERTRAGLYGPYLIVNHEFGDDWQFGIRGEPGGGTWNIRDDAGRSRNIQLSSYRLGVNANRRLTGEWWLGVMVGTTLGNEIEVRDPSGGNRVKNDLGESMFGQVMLRLRSW